MNWVFIAILSGNLVTSMHLSEEACRGRKAMWDKDHSHSSPASQCVDMYPPNKNGVITFWNGNGGRLGELSGTTQNTTETWSH